MATRTSRFSRISRLTKPIEYRKVFQCAKRFADSQLLVLVRNNGMSSARLGMALSGKKIPSAVVRNRLKRLIRESFRKEQNRLYGLDIVVLVQKKLTRLDNGLINRSLSAHWSRLEKCREPSPQPSGSTDVG